MRERVELGTRLTVSSIRFFCDLTRADGLVIPLGAISEVVIGGMRGLGMIARTEISRDETAHLGELARRQLCQDTTPFDYLSELFDEAWENAQPGRALAYLSERHCHSLHFSVPEEKDIGAPVLPDRPHVRSIVFTTLDSQSTGLFSSRRISVPSKELFEVAEF